MKECFRALRKWALFSCLCVTDARISALLDWRVGDVRMNWRTSAGVGAAVLHFPAKTWDGDEVSVKPMGEAIRPLLVWLAFLERLLGGPLDPQMPVWLSVARADAPGLSDIAVRTWLSGQERNGVRTPVPRDPANPYDGYAPHRIRAAAIKALESPMAGAWLRRRRIDIPQDLLAEALADHRLAHQRGRYHVVDTPEGRAEAAGIAIACLWDCLTGDAGKRLGRDRRGFVDGLRAQRDLDAEEQVIAVELDRLEDEIEAGAERAPRRARARELRARDRTIGRMQERLALDLARIRSGEPDRLVPLPDELSDDELDFDPKEVEAQLTSALGARPGAVALVPVRSWLTSNEFTELVGHSHVQTCRWLKGERLPEADRHRPWESDRVPVQRLSTRKTRVLVAGLRPEFLDHGDRRRRLLVMLSSWPAWNAELCVPNAQAPEWMAERS